MMNATTKLSRFRVERGKSEGETNRAESGRGMKRKRKRAGGRGRGIKGKIRKRSART